MKTGENEKFRMSPTTLDEAIANLEDPVNSHDATRWIENRQLLDWLRELRDARSNPVGNSAEMRDALTEIRDTIMNGGFDGRSPAHFVNICDAALSKPARNCDRPECETSKAAQDVWHKEDGGKRLTTNGSSLRRRSGKDTAMEGNQQKMREALVEISKFADDWQSYANTKAGALDRIYELANAAIATPPRNCDVGSEEEQSRRYEAFCEAHHMQCDKGCSACPCSKKSGVSCELYWAQMSYGAAEGDSK